MKWLASTFRFLGGITFAVLLIAATALFVIAGTLLESVTNSHRYAASFTYGSPLFLLLLSLFFVNILVSALRRRPFKRHHVPFLITHLGLLLILAGTITKQLIGTQGTLRVVEGSGSHQILLSDSYALEVTTPNSTLIWPVSVSQSNHVDSIQLTCSQWRANSRELLELWIKGDYALIEGLPALPVSSWDKLQTNQPLPIATTVKVGETLWSLHALRTADVAELAACSYLDGLTFSHGQQTHGSVRDLLTTVLQTSTHPIQPFVEPKLTVIGEDHSFHDIPLQLGAEATTTIDGMPFTLSRQPAIFLVEDAQGDCHLWVMNSTGQIGSELFRRDALDSLLAYRDGFGGYALASNLVPGMECPVTRRHVVRTPSKRMEDNLPLIVLRAQTDDAKELVPLTYDRYASGMRWPVLNGRLLVRFQPVVQEIPYHVRLHDARQVSYPGSKQPYSYEAIVTICDRRTGSEKMTTLSMNQVHETSDGYRFYLSHLSPAGEESVRQIQVVVNHDPVKYWLTYPGAVALSLGIVLLFLFRRPRT